MFIFRKPNKEMIRRGALAPTHVAQQCCKITMNIFVRFLGEVIQYIINAI